MTQRTAFGFVRRYVPDAEAQHYVRTIWSEARARKVDPLLVVSLVAHESAFKRQARSRVGARGLGQLMPDTARQLGVKNCDNADDNLRGCVTLVHSHLDTFHGDPKRALAAYNAGAGAVRYYHGIPPYQETRTYVHRIMHTYWHLQKDLSEEQSGRRGQPDAELGLPGAARPSLPG